MSMENIIERHVDNAIDLSNDAVKAIRFAERHKDDGVLMLDGLSRAKAHLDLLNSKNPIMYNQIISLYDKTLKIYNKKYLKE